MLFNGTTSRAETTGLGGFTGVTGPLTFAAVVRLNSLGAWHNILSVLNVSTTTLIDLTVNDTDFLTMEVGAASATGPDLTASGTGWYYVGADKAGGAATPRFHHQKSTDATMTHTAGSQALDTTAIGTPTKIGLGSFNNNGDFFDGDMLVVGVWNRQLTDNEHEYLRTSLTGWLSMSPAWMVVGDYQTLPTNVPDYSGGGAPLTTLTSLAVTTQSMPWFTYGGPANYVTRQPSAAPANFSFLPPRAPHRGLIMRRRH